MHSPAPEDPVAGTFEAGHGEPQLPHVLSLRPVPPKADDDTDSGVPQPTFESRDFSEFDIPEAVVGGAPSVSEVSDVPQSISDQLELAARQVAEQEAVGHISAQQSGFGQSGIGQSGVGESGIGQSGAGTHSADAPLVGYASPSFDGYSGSGQQQGFAMSQPQGVVPYLAHLNPPPGVADQPPPQGALHSAMQPHTYLEHSEEGYPELDQPAYERAYQESAAIEYAESASLEPNDSQQGGGF